MTKIVNLFGGPGCGKSTTAAGVFYELKQASRNVELVTEVAKDLTWSERSLCIKCQPLIFGKQLYRLERLIDKVDWIITDSPLLLSLLYVRKDKYPQSFCDTIADIYKSFDNVNYLLIRDKEYKKIGRSQTLDEAKSLDRMILDCLEEHDAVFDIVGSKDAVNKIVGKIMKGTE